MTASVSFRFLIILFGLLIIAGCGKRVVGEKITTPPPFEESQGIAIAPFIVPPTAEKLGKWVPINLATNLELTFKNKGKEIMWTYDQSEALNPVASKLQEMGITLTHIFEDTALAAKVGRELNADLIVMGQLDDPKFQRKDYHTLLQRLGRQAGISGSATYVRKRLSAIVHAWIKVIDTKSGQLIFNNSITDYIKYWYAFQTQQRRQVAFKTDEEMMADLSKHLTGRIGYALYPAGMPKVKEGEVLVKPPYKLLGTEGPIRWE